MPPREIATVENCIAEARQMQESGKYINGTVFHMLADEVERLRKIETAARALKFSAYPAHGSGFVMQVSGGNINDLESALAAGKE